MEMNEAGQVLSSRVWWGVRKTGEYRAYLKAEASAGPADLCQSNESTVVRSHVLSGTRYMDFLMGFL